MTPLLGGNSGVMIRASGIIVPGISRMEVEPTCSHLMPARSFYSDGMLLVLDPTCLNEGLYLRYSSKKLVSAGLDNSLDLVEGKVQVELLIVDPTVADHGLRVAVGLEPVEVAEEGVQLLRSLQLPVPGHVASSCRVVQQTNVVSRVVQQTKCCEQGRGLGARLQSLLTVAAT